MLYWVFKWVLFTPVVRLVFRPRISGEHHIPDIGPAILVSNHISYGDTFVLPSMIRRRVTFPAKAELFSGRSVGGRIVRWFLHHVGMLPMDRAGGRASATSMDPVLEVLRQGHIIGIYPEGTRSPDGRLYKGKTGVARLVLAARVPVIPVGMKDSQFVPSAFLGVPTIRHPVITIGPPLDFSRYAGAGNDRDVLRWVTDEIMGAVQQLSGQTYVDAYGASAKAARADGRHFDAPELSRPGEGRPVPPIPLVPLAPTSAEAGGGEST